MTISIYINTEMQKNTKIFCWLEHTKQADHHETHNDHSHTWIFTVQSRNIIVLKYAVRLFHPETIKISTEWKHET